MKLLMRYLRKQRRTITYHKESIRGGIYHPLVLEDQGEDVGIAKTKTRRRNPAGLTLRPPTWRRCLAGARIEIAELKGGVLKG